MHRQVLKECRTVSPPRRQRSGALQWGPPMRSRYRSEERRGSRYHQGTWTAGGSPGQRAQVNKSYFYLFLNKTAFPNREHDARYMIKEVKATSWRLGNCILVRELAATHRLGRMRRLRMLEEKKVRKREAGFDNVETTAEMDAERLHAGFDSEPFYTKLYYPR